MSKELEKTSIQKLYSIMYEITREEGTKEILDLYTMVDYLKDVKEELEKLHVYENSEPIKDLNDLSGLAWKYCQLHKIDKIGNENKSVAELCNSVIFHLNKKRTVKNLETYAGTKKTKGFKNPLDLLTIVMYGNEHQRAMGEVDEAYEDLRKILKPLTPPRHFYEGVEYE